MGAGKSVLTRAAARGMGVDGPVPSPTFTILNIYENSPLTLYHYDAYRLKSGEEAYGSGLTDYLRARDGVCVIEWAQNIASALPKKLIKIQINYLNATEREIIYEL